MKAAMRRPILVAFVLVLLLAPSGPAQAWGPLGHRLVAALAWDGLNPQARAGIAALLAGEPEPTLAGVADWADRLRGRDSRLGKRSARWHYVNLAADACHYDANRDCPDGDCVVGAIDAQLAILADHEQSAAARRKALKFVVHLVGDVHQPLHAGYARDRGGNTVQIDFHGDGSNLHQLWDSGLLHATGLDEDDYLRRLRSFPPETGLVADPAAWAEGSCRIVLRPGFYPANARIGDAYPRRWQPMVDAQLRRAGAHLALVLNQALGAQR